MVSVYILNEHKMQKRLIFRKVNNICERQVRCLVEIIQSIKKAWMHKIDIFVFLGLA